VSSIVGRLEMSISPAPTHAVAFQKPCVGGGPVPGAKLARSACFSERNVRGRKSRRLVPESTMYLAPPLRSRAPPPPAAVARLVAEQREIRARHAQRLQIDPPEVDFFDGYVPVRPRPGAGFRPGLGFGFRFSAAPGFRVSPILPLGFVRVSGFGLVGIPASPARSAFGNTISISAPLFVCGLRCQSSLPTCTLIHLPSALSDHL
jgi:hypothetical protein